MADYLAVPSRQVHPNHGKDDVAKSDLTFSTAAPSKPAAFADGLRKGTWPRRENQTYMHKARESTYMYAMAATFTQPKGFRDDDMSLPVRVTADDDGDATSFLSERQPLMSYRPQPKASSPVIADLQGVWILVKSSWFHILLVFVPFAFISEFAHWDATWIFALCFMGLLPLANLLCIATETLAIHCGELIGGLLNATMGNAVEILVMILALLADKIAVVQASLIGSMFSNALLVLGCAFIAQGIYFEEARFNAIATGANVTLLMIGAFAMILPYEFRTSDHSVGTTELTISIIAAFLLLFMYGSLLFFIMKTHRHMVMDAGEGMHHAEPEVSFVGSLIMLVGVTALVGTLSEFLVRSIDETKKQTGMTDYFIGIVIIPVIGNAVEHLTAVKVAVYDKMDLSLSIAIGSATQVVMFVIPMGILIGWATGHHLSIAFDTYLVIIFILAIAILYAITGNGKSNWLEGSMLVGVYVLIAVSVWFERPS